MTADDAERVNAYLDAIRQDFADMPPGQRSSELQSRAGQAMRAAGIPLATAQTAVSWALNGRQAVADL